MERDKKELKYCDGLIKAIIKCDLPQQHKLSLIEVVNERINLLGGGD